MFSYKIVTKSQNGAFWADLKCEKLVDEYQQIYQNI